MSNIRPIDAYFAQGEHGHSTLYKWVFGFWFALLVWIVGQNVVGVPMVDGLYAVDPDGYKEMMERTQSKFSEPATAIKVLFGGLLWLIASILALVLFFVSRNNTRSSGNVMRAITWICMGISLIGIGFMLTMNDPQDVKLITGAIPKSKLVYIAMLLGFPPLILGVFLSAKIVQQRSFKSVLTSAHKFRWKRVFFTMAVFWTVAGGITLLSNLLGLNEVSFVFDSSKFFGYALISLLLIPIQSASEEIMLRGYMNQGLGKYIKNPWIVFIITSALFMSLHLGNPEASEGAANGKLLITMSGYFLFGIFACILTYIDGGLESAIGMHVANNLYAAVFLGYDNSALPTPTVMKTTLNPQTDVIITLISLAIVVAILWKFRTPLNPDMPNEIGKDATFS